MRLYKYRTLNEYTKDLIINNKHYFSSIANLNDPFECQFELELSTSKKQIVEKIAKTYKNASEKELKKVSAHFEMQGTPQAIEMSKLVYTDLVLFAERIYEKGYVENRDYLYQTKKNYLLNEIINRSMVNEN